MLQIINYSEKAFAVVGDTRSHKESLRAAGGRFNAKLTCGAGWIFSKKSESAVTKIVSAANGGKRVANENENENPLKGARVYVGTYAKYNSGSIAGRWLNLADYANRAEFLAACRALHKDEHDPEFMFQDYEGVPSWMIGESHIDAEVWDQKPEPEEPVKGQTKSAIRALLEKAVTRGDLDYLTKHTAAAIEIGGRVFAFDKPTIETRFCHPDEPMDEARRWLEKCRTVKFFLEENLGPIDRKIAQLEGAAIGDLCGAFIYRECNGLYDYGVNAERYYLTKDAQAEPMDERTRAEILKALKAVRSDFEKRLKTWWKKYGPDKLHCWTYWRDA